MGDAFTTVCKSFSSQPFLGGSTTITSGAGSDAATSSAAPTLNSAFVMPLISAFLLENGYTGFSSLVQTYSEMEENGLVSTRTEGEERTFLSITQEGEETLRFFVNDLSAEIRDQIRVFLLRKG